MATATQGRPLTAEEYFALPPSAGPTELVRGEIVRLDQPGFRHGEVCSNIDYRLGKYVKERMIGHLLTNDSGILVERDPDTVRGTDVAFYSYDRVPRGQSPITYPDAVPEVIFEVRSPSNTWPSILTKVGEYQAAGIDMVVADWFLW